MNAAEFEGIDFATGVVRGVRSFRIDKMGRLTGINYPQVWKPGENEAECRKEDDRSYAASQQMMLGAAPIFGAYVNPNWGYSYNGSRFPNGNVSVEWDAATDTVTVDDGITIRRMTRSSYEQMMGMPAPRGKEPEPHWMEKCSHGFYAYYDGSNDYHDRGEVTGVVEGYGEVLIGTRGFRCMKARIVALRIPKSVPVRLAQLVARNYPDIPLFTSFNDMVAEFPPDGAGMEITPQSDPKFWTRSL